MGVILTLAFIQNLRALVHTVTGYIVLFLSHTHSNIMHVHRKKVGFAVLSKEACGLGEPGIDHPLHTTTAAQPAPVVGSELCHLFILSTAFKNKNIFKHKLGFF